MLPKEKPPSLLVSHYIYLNQEERHKLFNGEEVDVIGVSTPVWFQLGNTSEPAKEVFCRYSIKNSKEPNSVFYIEGMYKVLLQDIEGIKESKKLLDVKDGGCEELNFKSRNKISIDQKLFNIFHYVEIKPLELLLDTID